MYKVNWREIHKLPDKDCKTLLLALCKDIDIDISVERPIKRFLTELEYQKIIRKSVIRGRIYETENKK